MTGAAARVGVGTRLKYDGEVVVVEEMFGSAAGNELLVRDEPGRRFRLSLREALASGRAEVIPTGPGPEADDDRETASVLFAQLSDEELTGVRERAAHINEVLTGFRSGSAELPASGEPRAQYVASVPKLQRYEAKATELGMSVRTIKRWVRAFLLDREAGLVHGGPDRAGGDMGGLGRADARWVEMALEITAEHGKDSKPTRAKVIRSIGPRLYRPRGRSGRSAAFPNRWARQSHPGANELDSATVTTRHFDNRASCFSLDSTTASYQEALLPCTRNGRLTRTRPLSEPDRLHERIENSQLASPPTGQRAAVPHSEGAAPAPRRPKCVVERTVSVGAASPLP